MMQLLNMSGDAVGDNATEDAIWLYTKKSGAENRLIVTDIRCRYAVSNTPIDYTSATAPEFRPLEKAIGWAKAFAETHGIEKIYTVRPLN